MIRDSESRITFLPFSPKKWSGYLRRPQAESRKLGPARPEGQGPESRIPNHVSAIFAKKMVRVPPKTASRIPKAWPGPARGAGARITNPESRITFLPFSPKKWSGYLRRPQAESRKLGPARPEGQGPESRIPNHVSAIFAKKMVRVPPKTASRIPKAWPGPARGQHRLSDPIDYPIGTPVRSYIRSLNLSWGAGARITNPESRFCHFRQKNGPGTSEDRKPNPGSLARPGPRGRGPNHESRIPNHVSAIFAKKMVRVLPKTASRIPKAWPGPARGAGPRITNPESRFCHFRQKNGPGTSEDRKPNPESLARPGPRGRGPNHESRITFLPFSPTKWSGHLRRPQAESRKLGPARPEGQGPESRIPNHVSAIFAKKMVWVPPKTASRIPKAWPGPARGARITNPESRITFLPFSPKKMVRVPPKTASRIPKAWPGPARGAGARITNPESRFCHFRQKNGPGTSEDRKPNPESLARPGPRNRGPNHESRIPNHVSAIFAKKMVRVPPKTASRIPKAWPGPARGAGARIPNPESRFCHFRQKNGPGTSEDRKPSPESLARPGPRGRGPNHESRIPNHVSAIFAKSRKCDSRIPNHVFRSPDPESRKCDSRIPNHETRIPNHVFRSPESRNANPESRFPEPRITKM